MNCHITALGVEKAREVVETGKALRQPLQMVMSGYDLVDWEKQKEFAIHYPGLVGSHAFLALGFHPWKSSKFSSLEVLRRDLKSVQMAIEAQSPKPHFLGEIGLDKNVCENHLSMTFQLEVFQQMLKLGIENKSPFILHVVSSHESALASLRRFQKIKGIVHGFSGSKELALEYIRLGLKISIGPAVFLSQFKKLKSCFEEPRVIEQMVFETDQPHSLDQPEGYSFSVLPQVIREVSKLSGLKTKDLVTQSRRHFLELLGSA